jgi:HTH-type transcriptional regulator, transcriptional repressor of NAD biosynthesis genes
MASPAFAASRMKSAPAARCIALLGAESTGKTELALALTQHLRALGHAVECVPEYLRTWCNEQGRTPVRAEQTPIALTQSRRITTAMQDVGPKGMVVADTTALMTAVYSDYVFQDTSLYAQALADHAQQSSHTLLLACDLPWVADGIQRTGAHIRSSVDSLLRQHLSASGIPFSVIYGHGPARLRHALTALQLDAVSSDITKATASASDTKPRVQWQWLCDRCSDADCEHRLFRI